MLLDITIRSKAFGPEELYSDLSVSIESGEKVGLVGRNGVGKSTLLDIISGQDLDYDGDVMIGKNIIMISSRQEHHDHANMVVLEYILGDLPEYKKLKHILDTYPETMGDSNKKMHEYSESIERFTTLGYFEIENSIERIIDVYQLPNDILQRKMDSLSGGQLRLVELTKVQAANAHLALIDEPTNHMDYVAKEDFIKWLQAFSGAAFIITHDRDVLGAVDRIIEIIDGKAQSFSGNYDKYLKINSDRMSGAVNEYEITKARIRRTKDDIVRYRRLKERARNPGTIRRFKGLEEKAVKELSDLEALDKPSFWIDQGSTQNLSTKLQSAYQEHKAKTITLRIKSKTDSERKLLSIDQLSLGYDSALFTPVTFEIYSGGRIELKGRNGIGKTTLVSAIINHLQGEQIQSSVFSGTIDIDNAVPIGVYSQTFDDKYLDRSLSQAIEAVHREKNIDINDQKIRGIMSDFLFNPAADKDKKVRLLSGGQKARLQLIAMLANEPQIIFLDEPTNHLDLPSIEELETALKQYRGAIVYVSHDSRFVNAIGGTTVELSPATQ
ncbi:TPA: ABC-F family ATP-binding cassette domain-containing protein [Candidatus Saccharibacteria bacterium]|nr:ABC-F family ATP-binding cassette domain-containing protein [Candidatus Saccharibacteria bacterium]HIO88015.1 ABC-F family ATP-binding cassette domain-containing protein [Candidatus Saccharibacteria bacterium]